MAPREYTIKKEGGKKYLIIDCKGCPYGSSIADFPACMAEVIGYLQQAPSDVVILSDVYEKIYDEHQTKMLREIADLADLFEREGVWTYSKLGGAKCEELIPARHDVVVAIAQDLLKTDPVKAYWTLLNTLRRELETFNTLPEHLKECTKTYLRTLKFMKAAFEKTELIKRVALIVKKLGKLPAGRTIYHTLFEPQIKPPFISSRVFFRMPKGIELVDQYSVSGATVSIYRHPEKLEYLYYLNPPEYNLTPEKYFLLAKTREIVAKYRPQGVVFMEPMEMKRYFLKVYKRVISDLASQNNISLTGKEIEELGEIVARYTIGYGMFELILSDRKLTDVYLDAPLGSAPIYVVHSDYGTCKTNVIFTEEEAKTFISKLRAMSGRPFDEAHPVLDYDLPDLQTRVAVIGPPLSPDGTAFALRLHKITPWTLPQFIDVKMLNSTAAGLLSFLVDAQASTLVTGSRGAGKTSLLSSLMLEILRSYRIIVQEDTLELPVPYMKKLGFNVQRLKTRSPLAVATTTSEVAPEEALRTALRLGESVLIIGEVRSREALVLYEAMRIGAVGNVVMGTIHGESAYSVWDRIVHDLGVPNTSFKATDMVVVAAPVRFKGAIKRERRLVEVVEVGKHWYEDPEKEGGFLKILDFDVKRDEHILLENAITKSEFFKKVARQRGLSVDDLLADIRARAQTKQFLVDMKNKYGIPKLLEADYTVPANDMWLLILERQREEMGGVDYKKALQEWKQWVLENQIKHLVRARG